MRLQTKSAIGFLFTAVVLFLSAVGAVAQSDSGARIPSGAKIIVRVNQEISSATAQAGQRWTGTLVNDIRSGGTVVAPQNSTVMGTITNAKSSGRLGGKAELDLQVTTVNNIPVATDILSRDGAGHTKSNVAKIGGTAAAGALIGALAGGGKGAAVGTVAGAGVGTAGAAATGKKEAVIAAETALTFKAQ